MYKPRFPDKFPTPDPDYDYQWGTPDLWPDWEEVQPLDAPKDDKDGDFNP